MVRALVSVRGRSSRGGSGSGNGSGSGSGSGHGKMSCDVQLASAGLDAASNVVRFTPELSL